MYKHRSEWTNITTVNILKVCQKGNNKGKETEQPKKKKQKGKIERKTKTDRKN